MTGDKVRKEKKRGKTRGSSIDPEPEAKVEAGGRRRTKGGGWGKGCSERGRFSGKLAALWIARSSFPSLCYRSRCRVPCSNCI